MKESIYLSLVFSNAVDIIHKRKTGGFRLCTEGKLCYGWVLVQGIWPEITRSGIEKLKFWIFRPKLSPHLPPSPNAPYLRSYPWTWHPTETQIFLCTQSKPARLRQFVIRVRSSGGTDSWTALPSARGSCHCAVWGMIDVSSLTPARDEAVSAARTRDLQVTMEQLYRAKPTLHESFTQEKKNLEPTEGHYTLASAHRKHISPVGLEST